MRDGHDFNGDSAMTWTVGPVQDTSFGNHRGPGFNIIEEGRGPLLTLVYDNKTEATKAAKLVRDALNEVRCVGTSPTWPDEWF
jgi:hypothetical protein